MLMVYWHNQLPILHETVTVPLNLGVSTFLIASNIGMERWTSYVSPIPPAPRTGLPLNIIISHHQTHFILIAGRGWRFARLALRESRLEEVPVQLVTGTVLPAGRIGRK